MTTREDFEKWFADSYGIDISIDRAGEGYIYDQINDKWIGYQACAAHYEAELLKRDALIAEKDKALEKFAKGPMRPMPDPGSHSWEAFGKAWMEYATDCKFAAIHALSLSLTHDSVRLVEVAKVDRLVNSVCLDSSGCEKRWDYLPDGTKLYTIVKGEAGD